MFESAKLKIKRAYHHIGELEAEFAAYVATKPHRFSVQHYPEADQSVVEILFVSNPPKKLSLIIGDTIHNLRTALDHLTWEVVGIDGGTQDRHLTFRTGDCRDSFEASCKGIITPSDWVKDLHISLEVFPGGRGNNLYTLHMLDNLDKHTVITPVVRATTHPDFRVLDPDGRVQQVWRGNVLIGGTGRYFDLPAIPPGWSVKIQDDAQCTPDIFFGDINGPGQPVIPTLKQSFQMLVGAVQAFEMAVADNG